MQKDPFAGSCPIFQTSFPDPAARQWGKLLLLRWWVVGMMTSKMADGSWYPPPTTHHRSNKSSLITTAVPAYAISFIYIPGKVGWFILLLCSLVRCANNQVHYGPMVVFVFCTLHCLIFIIIQTTYIKVLNFWTNAGPIHWRIYAALGGDELKGTNKTYVTAPENWCCLCHQRTIDSIVVASY